MSREDLYRIPFVVGITGHRDILSSQIPAIRMALVSLLRSLKEAHPDVRIQVLCSMADGADLLVAEVALDLDIDVLAFLTFPEQVCRSDLLSDAARKSFDRVIPRAEKLELPVSQALARELAQGLPSGPERDRQYQFAGLLLSRYCSLLIAIWDGKPTTHVAGSARVVEFRQLGYRQTGAAGQTDVLLDAVENDLMFEIRCARESDPAAVAAQPPAQILGFSGEDVDPPAGGDLFALPPSLDRLLARTAEFNGDSVAAQENIAAHAWPLIPAERQSPPPALLLLNQLFVQADYLGSHFRQRFLKGIRRRYLLWAGMATLLIAFGTTSTGKAGLVLVLAVLGVFAFSLFHARKAQRGSWHRKCLDYRALAEALRVDYYWEISGVRQRFAGEFAHKTFLQKQDSELAWIRAAMRSVSLRVGMRGAAPPDDGIAEVLNNWIGHPGARDRSGQIHYYDARSRQLRQRVRRDERLDQVPVVIGTLLSFIFLCDIVAELLVHPFLPGSVRSLLAWAMALSTAYGSIYEVYVTARGDRPLIRQYRHMHTLFGRAAGLLQAARTREERLEVLRSLGHACLAEHAQWTLAQRDKTIEGLKW